MGVPLQIQALVDAISALPGVAACSCDSKRMAEFKPNLGPIPAEFDSVPQVAVAIQTEVIFHRSPEGWLSLEFLAWWVGDWGRIGHEIQIRPTALPPKTSEVQLGRTLKFLIDYFLIEEGDSNQQTLEVAAEMSASIASNFEQYRECFDDPAEFTGDVEST